MCPITFFWKVRPLFKCFLRDLSQIDMWHKSRDFQTIPSTLWKAVLLREGMGGRGGLPQPPPSVVSLIPTTASGFNPSASPPTVRMFSSEATHAVDLTPSKSSLPSGLQVPGGGGGGGVHRSLPTSRYKYMLVWNTRLMESVFLFFSFVFLNLAVKTLSCEPFFISKENNDSGQRWTYTQVLLLRWLIVHFKPGRGCVEIDSGSGSGDTSHSGRLGLVEPPPVWPSAGVLVCLAGWRWHRQSHDLNLEHVLRCYLSFRLFIFLANRANHDCRSSIFT